MTPSEAAIAKQAAAEHAVKRFVKQGIRLGLGSGTTAAFAVHALAARMKSEGLTLSAIVSTSDETLTLARSLGISVLDGLPPNICPLDVTIDGADDVDRSFNLIKGGGGALLREKIVARATTQEVIIVDTTKYTDILGTIFPLPVMVVPYGWELTKTRVEAACGKTSVLRKKADGSVFVSDDGLYCLDVEKQPINDPAALERGLLGITGVVDVGLFIGIAKNVVIGHSDGAVSEPVKVAS